MQSKKLVFVYNADGTAFAQATDFVKKIVAPASYDCNLCKVSYGVFGPRGEWKEFLDTISYEKTFLHRDEFHVAYQGELKEISLPAVLIEDSGETSVLLSSDEINGAQNVQELIALVKEKLSH